MNRATVVLLASFFGLSAGFSAETVQTIHASPKAPLGDPSFFPIAVWVQNPRHAERYKAAGINTYVGLWRGPTEEQLAQLEKEGMRLVCAQNATGLRAKDNPMIIAWMHGDEPDNAQSLGQGKGYGPPILPSKIVADYQKMRANDPARPILLNLGQGVAWDNYIGRGVRRNHPEDYPEYLQGCDIASFDIYPPVHDHADVAGKLEFVAHGVERLVRWTDGKKPVWNCINCTRISNTKTKPTPAQVRSMVWMSIIHGSRGLIYFVHQFQPEFREAALLDDPEMLAAVTVINEQVSALAPVINNPALNDAVAVESSDPSVPVAVLAQHFSGNTYIFAAGMRNSPVRATFRLRNQAAGRLAEVLGEKRRIELRNGSFSDEFDAYGVHLYRLENGR